MREPYSGIPPCEEIPLAKEIYERYQMLSEKAWSSGDKGMKQYLAEHRLWLTYGWYVELLTKERTVQEEKALEVIGQFYGEKETDAALLDRFADILNRYWQVLWRKGKQRMLASLRETAPVVYEYFWTKMEPSYVSDSIGIIMVDGLHDEHLQNFLESNKECLDQTYQTLRSG